MQTKFQGSFILGQTKDFSEQKSQPKSQQPIINQLNLLLHSFIQRILKMFSDCCQAQSIPTNRYRNESSRTQQISRKQAKVDKLKDSQEGMVADEEQFTDTPLKVKLLDVMGLRQFVIDKLVFARPQTSYRLQQTNNFPKTFTFTTTKLKPLPGYQTICEIIDLPNHYIPVIHFKRLPQSSSTHQPPTSIDQLKLLKSPLTMIYSHGNSSNLQLSFQIVQMMAKKYPVDYVIYDYTGYGNSCGKVERFREKEHKLSDKSICADLLEVIKWSQVPSQQIVLWGYSLGCHPSIHAATKLKPNSLILQSPFTSIYHMLQPPSTQTKPYKDDIFNNLSLIPNILCDCLLIHSQDDDLIPVEHSRTLMRKFNNTKNNLHQLRFIEICNIKHNQMPIVFCVKKSNPLQEELTRYLLSRASKLKEKTTNNNKTNDMKKKPIPLDDNLSSLQERLSICIIDDQQISKLSESIQSSVRNSTYQQMKAQSHKYFHSVNNRKPQKMNYPPGKFYSGNSFQKAHLNNITISTHETEVSDEILLSEKEKHEGKMNFESQKLIDGNSLKTKKSAYSFSVN